MTVFSFGGKIMVGSFHVMDQDSNKRNLVGVRKGEGQTIISSSSHCAPFVDFKTNVCFTTMILVVSDFQGCDGSGMKEATNMVIGSSSSTRRKEHLGFTEIKKKKGEKECCGDGLEKRNFFF